MLVVMGIILLLVALLLPAVNGAYKQSVRNRMLADLQTISQGLEEYRNAFGDYPRSGSAVSVQGAYILCWGLIAPGPATADGADGPGFRLRSTDQGTVYGPYVALDKFQLGTVGTGVVTPVKSPTIYSDTATAIGDYYSNVILYFPANKSVSPTTAYLGNYTPGTTPPQAMYNFKDNSALFTAGSTLSQVIMAHRLGDINNNYVIDGSEVPATVAPYILWSAGPDGKFGPALDTAGNVVLDDDVTYPPLNPLTVGSPP